MSVDLTRLPGAAVLSDDIIAAIAPHQMAYGDAIYTVSPAAICMAGVASVHDDGPEQIVIVLFAPPEVRGEDGFALSFSISAENARTYAAALFALADRLETAAAEEARAALARAAGR